MIGPLGRLGAAAALGQHCPQMTQRPGRGSLCNVFSNSGMDFKYLSFCLGSMFKSVCFLSYHKCQLELSLS